MKKIPFLILILLTGTFLLYSTPYLHAQQSPQSGWDVPEGQTPASERLVNSMSEELMIGVLEKPGSPTLLMVVDKRLPDEWGKLSAREVMVKLHPAVNGITQIGEYGSLQMVKGQEIRFRLLPGGGALLELDRKISLPEVHLEPAVLLFTQETLLSFHSNGKQNELRYTLDDADPGDKSLRYQQPIRLRESAQIRAVAIAPSGIQSSELSGYYAKVLPFKKAIYSTPFSPKYPASGNDALIDRQLGSLNFKDGKWQAFLEEDMEVVIELNEATPVTALHAHFLQENYSGIFFPEAVTFEVSSDGLTFQPFGEMERPLAPEEEATRTETYEVRQQEAVHARFVRVKARNPRRCPAGRLQGSPAWLFVDEIWAE